MLVKGRANNATEKRKTYSHEYYLNNPEKHNKECNREHRNELMRIREKEKRKDPQHRLNHNISNSILKSLKGNKNGRSWETLVGYTLTELKKHLEKHFTKNMSWNNYPSYWQVDHIIPKSWFKYKMPEDKEFKQAWALCNLQPLEAKKNQSKHNRYIKDETEILKIVV